MPLLHCPIYKGFKDYPTFDAIVTPTGTLTYEELEKEEGEFYRLEIETIRHLLLFCNKNLAKLSRIFLCSEINL